MKFRQFFEGFVVMMCLQVALSMPGTVAAKSPWDIVVVDVSGDMLARDKEGRSDAQLLDAAIAELKNGGAASDSVMVFARGRALISFADLVGRYGDDCFDHRFSIGDGTGVYDALVSLVNKTTIPKRVLIISNGVDNGSRFSYRTASKILKSNGMRVDGLCVFTPADSVAYDSIYFKKSPYNKDFGDIVKSTGGRFESVSTVTEVPSALKRIAESKPAWSTPDGGFDHGWDQKILGDVLKRVGLRQLDIQVVDTAACVKYNGVVFKGLADILSGIGSCRDGVFVGSDSQGYPCFDEYDRQSEDRRYWNIYFAKSSDGLEEKRRLVGEVAPRANYCKLHEGVPLAALPMIYYSGEGGRMKIVGLEIVGYNF